MEVLDAARTCHCQGTVVAALLEESVTGVSQVRHKKYTFLANKLVKTLKGYLVHMTYCWLSRVEIRFGYNFRY